MSDKQEMIKKMIEMQKKFIAYEQKNGVTQEEYFTAGEGHELANYRQEYMEMAMKLVDTGPRRKGFAPLSSALLNENGPMWFTLGPFFGFSWAARSDVRFGVWRRRFASFCSQR